MTKNLKVRKIHKEDDLCSGKFQCPKCKYRFMSVLFNQRTLYTSPIIRVSCTECGQGVCLKWLSGDLNYNIINKGQELFEEGDECGSSESCIECGLKLFEFYGNYKSKYLSPLIYLNCKKCKAQHTVKFYKSAKPEINLSLY